MSLLLLPRSRCKADLHRQLWLCSCEWEALGLELGSENQGQEEEANERGEGI